MTVVELTPARDTERTMDLYRELARKAIAFTLANRALELAALDMANAEVNLHRDSLRYAAIARTFHDARGNQARCNTDMQETAKDLTAELER